MLFAPRPRPDPHPGLQQSPAPGMGSWWVSATWGAHLPREWVRRLWPMRSEGNSSGSSWEGLLPLNSGDKGGKGSLFASGGHGWPLELLRPL